MVEINKDYIAPTATAFVACFIFSAIILVYMTSAFVKKVSSAAIKDKISVDIIIKDNPLNVKDYAIKRQKLVKSSISNSIDSKALSKQAKTTSSIDDLFANLDEKYDNAIKRSASNNMQTKVASKRKTKLREQAKHKSDDIANILDSVDDTSSSYNSIVESDNKQTDAYYAKIRKMISSRWTPLVKAGNVHAVVLVRIDKNGVFSYKFLSYSSDKMFDEDIIMFLNSQTLQKYPVYKNNKSVEIEIKFGIKGIE